MMTDKGGHQGEGRGSNQEEAEGLPWQGGEGSSGPPR